MLFVAQGTQAFAIPPRTGRAAVVLIGDDLDRSMGPEGFHLPSVRRVIRACSAFMVVSSAPSADLYAATTAGAVGGKNVLIVETRPEHEIQWVSLIRKLAPGRPLCLATVRGGNA